MHTGNGQTVKKISINELENYIKQSRKPLVINFWATFCKPCLEEIPLMLELARTSPNVELIMVSLDMADYYPDKLEKFVSQQQFQPAVQYWLNETNADFFCPKVDSAWQGSLPATLFINPQKQYRQFVDKPMRQEEIRLSFLSLDATAN
ncbi:TlpA disulfide reductase family protein [Flavihumibacter petaseus]|uniref:Putative thiol-disulfide oxidoreductase n=1 Tax=Flavihumibacter petaseus NBRC 106054 TaxID=1220578 RepID=A0A0E9N330_9BACT|nr:TlpA disulfide reductase family protein [Flavihumibacter petaseus]GAO44367.1 putative thiol-disulfide oxidoreductase [Flavihumibacter petaseus NBRC 106054]